MEYVSIYPCNEAAVQKDLDWMACKEEAMFVVGGIFTTRMNAEIICDVMCASEASCVSSAGGFVVWVVHLDSPLSNEFDCSISHALTKPTFQAEMFGPNF